MRTVNLNYLNFSYNNIASLKGIEKLVNLEVLYCTYNNITSLKGIDKLTMLTELYCSNNRLTSLLGIEKLKDLSLLDCASNQLPYKTNELYDILKVIKSEKRKQVISKLLNTKIISQEIMIFFVIKKYA